MPLSRTSELLKWVKGPKVLDVGCTSHNVEVGSPYWLHGQLRERFPDVTGIDISRDNVGKLRSAGFCNLHVQSAETFELPEKFDTIIAGELIEHLANPGLFLDRALHHLNSHGRVVLTTPNPFSIAYSLYAFLKFPQTCQNSQHTCWFCPRTMTALAERHGFVVQHMDLIDDYRSDESSLAYRQFGRLMKWFGGIIPKRLKKTMLCVLAPDGRSNPA